MSLFDLFMPEVAEATHLRRIAESLQQRSRQQSLGHATQAGPAGRLQRLEEEVEELRADNGLLTLLVLSLLKTLCEHTGATIAEVRDLLLELDLSDGKADGRIESSTIREILHLAPPEQPEPQPRTGLCDRCGRALSKKHNRCLFCGWSPA